MVEALNPLPLFAWMTERHAIYERRRSGAQKPWTSDPVLQSYRFCNVFRELDTTTIWIRENIREPYADHPNLWFMLAIARTFNRVEFLKQIVGDPIHWPKGESFDLRDLAGFADAEIAAGRPVYTGAYMIRAESDPKKTWYSWSKQRYICEIVLGRLWEDRAEWADFLRPDHVPPQRLEWVWTFFQKPRYVGWGPFMAYEVVTDLRWTRYLRDAPDIYTWANAGPGALRGLSRLANDGALGKTPSRREALHQMRELLDIAQADPEAFPRGFPKLEMRDIEHSLCEYDKYERVKRGEGKPRSRYPGSAP